MNPDPSILRSEVASMKDAAAVCIALDGGTVAMREAGKKYLPKWPLEEEDAWKARKDCSALFPAMSKALNVMVGKPFSEEVVIEGPSTILTHTENIDNAGRDLETFARDTFRSALRDGITWILVDCPPAKGVTNLAQERALKIRPYWVHLKLEQLCGWRTQTINGAPRVTQLRFLEPVEVEDGMFGTKTVTQVRVLGPGYVQVWRQKENKEWFCIDSYVTSMTDEIPVVPIYGERTGFWTAKPPLEDMAWLSVQHWQSSSDQRNILHSARVPLLAAEQDNRTDTTAPVMAAGSGLIVGLQGLGYVEPTGAAIASGRQDLIDLEDQMRRVAGELLSRQAGTKTATESGLESNEGNSWLKSKVRMFQDALEECFRFHAKWMKESKAVTVQLNDEWDDAELDAQMLTALTTARQSGLISQDVYSYNVQRSGLFPEGRTVEEERESLDSEAPMPMPTTPKVA